jgi:hypothetical protein
MQKESVFIPTGFDSVMLIDALCKGSNVETKVFEEVIKKPSQVSGGPAAQNKPEISCDDWQSVLSKSFGSGGPSRRSAMTGGMSGAQGA